MFSPGSVHVRFVVDKVALGQVFLQILQFSPFSIIPPILHTYFIHLSLILHRVNEKCMARPIEGESKPQYKKNYCMHIGILKHGFQITAF